MKVQLVHVLPFLSAHVHLHLLKVLFILVAVLIHAWLLFSPAEVLAAQAVNHTDPMQSEIAMVACYGVYHIVRPGQTLYSIAAAYGTTAYRIAMCNGISSYTVYVGQALLVPTYRSR
ncbi:MAG: LysM peptidoglycan-binding domain-containing protein [Caldilinea sp.]|uniref:LysM peptidoglycan-binding domain-containing protein n=1 Tax=Caldilinea sp. TaxID=2293560 RepID=UPI002C36FDE9|nr:LysM peptidoglycan-binding domain-containing protein [Anaerolineales bacterium]HQY90836.1 LysM peptidoglycan-binding domain-containing protein [Caldilinea sp.]